MQSAACRIGAGAGKKSRDGSSSVMSMRKMQVSLKWKRRLAALGQGEYLAINLLVLKFWLGTRHIIGRCRENGADAAAEGNLAQIVSPFGTGGPRNLTQTTALRILVVSSLPEQLPLIDIT